MEKLITHLFCESECLLCVRHCVGPEDLIWQATDTQIAALVESMFGERQTKHK